MAVIGVVSAKGGVGKTTVTANVGAALVSEFEKDVLLIDGNVTGANLGFHFGINYPKKTIADSRSSKVEDLIVSHSSGVKILSGSVELDSRLDPNMLQEIVDEVKGSYDYILIDSAPSLGREAIATLQATDRHVHVSTPDIPCATNVLKTIDMGNKLRKKQEGVVMNQVTGKKFELTPQEVSTICDNLKVLEVIRRSEEIPKSIALQTPLVLLKPNHPISREFVHLAATLAHEKFEPRSWYHSLLKIFQFSKPKKEERGRGISEAQKAKVTDEIMREALDVEKLRKEIAQEIKAELKESVKKELVEKLKKKIRERAAG